MRDTRSSLTRRRGFGARDEHRPDDEVSVEHRTLDLVGVGGHGLAVALIDPVSVAKPRDVLVQQQDLCLHAERDRCCVHPRYPCPDDHDLGGVNP